MQAKAFQPIAVTIVGRSLIVIVGDQDPTTFVLRKDTKRGGNKLRQGNDSVGNLLLG